MAELVGSGKAASSDAISSEAMTLEQALKRICTLEEDLADQRASAEQATVDMLEKTNTLNAKDELYHSQTKELEQSKLVVQQLMRKIDARQSASYGNNNAAQAEALQEVAKLRESNAVQTAKVLELTNALNISNDKNHGLMRELKQLAEENKNLRQKVEDLEFENGEVNEENRMVKKQLADFKRSLNELKQQRDSQRKASSQSPPARDTRDSIDRQEASPSPPPSSPPPSLPEPSS